MSYKSNEKIKHNKVPIQVWVDADFKERLEKVTHYGEVAYILRTRLEAVVGEREAKTEPIERSA